MTNGQNRKTLAEIHFLENDFSAWHHTHTHCTRLDTLKCFLSTQTQTKEQQLDTFVM